MFLRILLLLTIVPIVELWTLFRVHDFLGEAYGTESAFMMTLALILLTGIVGAHLARTQGVKLVFEIQTQLNRGQMPGPALVDGALVLAGGALLLTPGFWTDLLGLLLLLPSTRKLFRAKLISTLKTRVATGAIIYDRGMRSSPQARSGEIVIDVDSRTGKKPDQ